jgi:thymidylate kinase
MSPVIKKFKDKISMDPKIYSLIHATDLLERYESLVVPALNEDKVVICDRYFHTSYARDKVRDAHAHLDEIYNAMRQPDIIFYCKAPIEDCIKRASERGVINYYASGMDLYLHHDHKENTKQYYELMDKAYDEVFDKEPNCHIIKTDKNVNEIAKEIQEIVEKYLNNNK